MRCLCLSRAGTFLVGTFYKPDCSSKYYDKDFMVKLNNMLDIAAAENKELSCLVILIVALCLISVKVLSVRN